MANPIICSGHFRPAGFRNRRPLAALAALALALMLLACPALQAATPAVGGNPATANEGTGPWITVNATNTQTSYNVVVYPGAVTFNATLSDGKVGVTVNFTFTDGSGHTQTSTAVTVAGGVAGASFTPAAPGACTCEASATGYTPGNGSANSLEVEYFYSGQQIPQPLADLPVPQKSDSEVNIQATPASVPIFLTTADTGLVIAQGDPADVHDSTGIPRTTSASALVGTAADNAKNVGLPSLPIKVEPILVRAHLYPRASGAGVGEEVVFSILGDTQHPLPTDFSGYLNWSEPEYVAGILPEIPFDSAYWKETGANTGTQNESGTPEGQWHNFPIANNGQNTATINCMDGTVDDTDSLNFITSPEVISVSVAHSPGEEFVLPGTSPQQIAITQTNSTNAPVSGQFTLTQTYSATWSTTETNGMTVGSSQQSGSSVSSSISLTADGLGAGTAATETASQSDSETAAKSDSNTSGVTGTTTVTQMVSYTADPGQAVALRLQPVGLRDQITEEAYPDGAGNGVATGPVQTYMWNVYYQPLGQPDPIEVIINGQQ